MLFSLYKATLDDGIRRGLESSAYSEMEIEGLRCQLRRQIEERSRATSGVLAFFAAFDAMLVMTKSSASVLIAMLAVRALPCTSLGIFRRVASSGSSIRPCAAGIPGSTI